VRAVIGVGNAIGGDDAAGLEAVRRLRPHVPADVELVEREGEPSGLLDAWEGAEEAIVVDAVRSGAPPGTVHRLDARRRPLPSRLLRSASTHALGVAEAVELGRALDRLPPRLLVYGIEGRAFEAGAGLAPAVERAVERVVEEVRADLARG
jgi:hydrogenase maturation protease